MKKFLFLFLISACFAQYASFDPTMGTTFSSGAGSTVTQATSRTTGVTINTITGQITTNTASLAAEAAAKFTVTDSKCGLHDVIPLSIQSGSNGGNTEAFVTTVAAGSFQICVSNNNAAAGTAETGAIILNFIILKGTAN